VKGGQRFSKFQGEEPTY